MKPSPLRWPMQIVAFMGKELADIIRQPRTLLVMVLGPFLIMAAFGLGYEESPPQLRTVFVVDPASPFRGDVEEYIEEFDSAVDVVGIVDTQDEADAMLRSDDVDIAVMLPTDPVSEVLAGERATLTVTHTRLDPIERTAIAFVSQAAVDDINSRVLSRILQTGRDEALGLADPVVIDRIVGGAATVVDGQLLAAILDADTDIIVRPLDRQVRLAVDSVDDVTDWYAPAAVVLMLQQFGVAFGAMSFVRERRLGINEVFRIAPVGGASSVVGKYLAYLGVGAGIAAALLALVVTTLGAPIEGSYGEIAAAMMLTLAASTGLGFAISLGSRTEAQAVQYTMLVLLASLFFSGFFLSLDQMQGPTRIASYLLPASYGMRMLRDTMLRDAGLEPGLLVGLAVYSAALAAVAVLGARRRMRSAV